MKIDVTPTGIFAEAEDDETLIGNADWKASPESVLESVDTLLERYGLEVTIFQATGDEYNFTILPREPTMTAWRPIDTVPKDHEVDLWCRNIADGSESRFPSMWINDEGKWEDWHSYVLEPKWLPTHWMEPPSPPS
jgi:hypothetical protein